MKLRSRPSGFGHLPPSALRPGGHSDQFFHAPKADIRRGSSLQATVAGRSSVLWRASGGRNHTDEFRKWALHTKVWRDIFSPRDCNSAYRMSLWEGRSHPTNGCIRERTLQRRSRQSLTKGLNGLYVLHFQLSKMVMASAIRVARRSGPVTEKAHYVGAFVRCRQTAAPFSTLRLGRCLAEQCRR
jgi:hypothetical protein